VKLQAQASSEAQKSHAQALIAANKLIDILPSSVEAASRGIASSNLTVLNGTDGVNQTVAGLVGQGLSIYETLRKSLVAQPAAAVASANAAQSNGGVTPTTE
jgi:flotillin